MDSRDFDYYFETYVEYLNLRSLKNYTNTINR